MIYNIFRHTGILLYNYILYHQLFLHIYLLLKCLKCSTWLVMLVEIHKQIRTLDTGHTSTSFFPVQFWAVYRIPHAQTQHIKHQIEMHRSSKARMKNRTLSQHVWIISQFTSRQKAASCLHSCCYQETLGPWTEDIWSIYTDDSNETLEGPKPAWVRGDVNIMQVGRSILGTQTKGDATERIVCILFSRTELDM